MAETKRERRVSGLRVRLTAQERVALERAARERGMKLSAAVRALLICALQQTAAQGGRT